MKDLSTFVKESCIKESYINEKLKLADINVKDIEKPNIGDIVFDGPIKWKVLDWCYYKASNKRNEMLRKYDIYGTAQEWFDLVDLKPYTIILAVMQISPDTGDTTVIPLDKKAVYYK